MGFYIPAEIVIRDARGKTEDLARGEVARLAMVSAYSSFMPIGDINLLQQEKYEASWPKGRKERLFVAERAGLLVGLTDLMLLDDDWRMVEPMHVRPGYQRLGIGKRLWSRCEDVIRERDGFGVKVWSLVANKSANAFYRDMGCEEVGDDATMKIGEHTYPMYAFQKQLA
jgi:GNAT superfamily N-acetyltransferase